VIINFSGSLQSVDLEYEVDVMFSTGEGVETEKIQEGKIRVFLKAFSGAVFKTKEKNIKIKL